MLVGYMLVVVPVVPAIPPSIWTMTSRAGAHSYPIHVPPDTLHGQRALDVQADPVSFFFLGSSLLFCLPEKRKSRLKPILVSPSIKFRGADQGRPI